MNDFEQVFESFQSNYKSFFYTGTIEYSIYNMYVKGLRIVSCWYNFDMKMFSEKMKMKMNSKY